jgi:thiol:disulfide interchange protein DsbD
MLVYGGLLLIGVAAGGKDWMQPLRGVAFVNAVGSESPRAHGMSFTRVESLADLEQRVAQATNQGRGVMLDYYADWCVTCKEMEKYTFSDPDVQAVLADTVLLQVDVTANNRNDKALLKEFSLIGPPAILFFDSDGNERRPYRVVGFMPAEEFSAHAARALR